MKPAMFSPRALWAAGALVVVGLALLAWSQWANSGPRVVVYCALDREFAEDILRDFETQTGIRVLPRFDSEANKSVGLYEDLIREAGHPRCDVHWNNEVLATIRLQKQGILQPYASPGAADFPRRYRASDDTWTAFAARARVLLVNTGRVKKEEMPQSLEDLSHPQWKGRVALAKPLFGTTATHAACLFQAWGPERAREFFSRLHANDVRILAGNKQVAVHVGAGQIDLGLTDTDDAYAELDAGRPVAMVYLDRAAPADSKNGVLFIPNTLAIVKNCPHPEEAKRLVDFLLRPEVEAKLAKAKSRQIPLNPKVGTQALEGMVTPHTATPMPVDFALAAEAWQQSQTFLIERFALQR